MLVAVSSLVLWSLELDWSLVIGAWSFELCEAEALELHAIMLTSVPSLIYWLPWTIQIMKSIKKWRSENLPVYFTINTGHTVHILVEEKNKDTLLKKLGKEKYIKKIVVNKPADGARLIDKHLF